MGIPMYQDQKLRLMAKLFRTKTFFKITKLISKNISFDWRRNSLDKERLFQNHKLIFFEDWKLWYEAKVCYKKKLTCWHAIFTTRITSLPWDTLTYKPVIRDGCEAFFHHLCISLKTSQWKPPMYIMSFQICRTCRSAFGKNASHHKVTIKTN